MKPHYTFSRIIRISLLLGLLLLATIGSSSAAQSYSRLIFTHGIGYSPLSTNNSNEYDELIVEKDAGIHPFNNNYTAIPICAIQNYHTSGDDDMSWACNIEETEYSYIFRLFEWGDGSGDGHIDAMAVVLDTRFYQVSSGAYFWLYSDHSEYQYFGSEIVWRDFEDTQTISFENLPDGVIPLVTINVYDANGDDDFSFNTLFNWGEEQFEMNAENGNDGSMVFGAIAFVSGYQGSNYGGQIDENGYMLRGNHPSGAELPFTPRYDYWYDANTFSYTSLFYYVPFDKDLSTMATVRLPYESWDEGISTTMYTTIGNDNSLVGFQTVVIQSYPYMEWTTY